MKKFISILILALSFSLYAQENAPNTEGSSAQNADVVFDTKSLSSDSVPPLVLHRGGIFNVYGYKLLSGENLSYGELNKLLKTVPENKSLLFKKNIWQGLDYAFVAGFCASVAVTAYANHKDWENMRYYGAASGVGCFVFAICSGMIAQSYRARAVDNYNLSVMGIPLN